MQREPEWTLWRSARFGDDGDDDDDDGDDDDDDDDGDSSDDREEEKQCQASVISATLPGPSEYQLRRRQV